MNFKRNMFAGVVLTVSALFAAPLASFAAAPTNAHVEAHKPMVTQVVTSDTGGGRGGGSDGDSSRGDWHWVSAASSTPGYAWQTFLAQDGWRNNITIREVNARVGNTAVCQNSKIIWWIRDRGGRWTYDYTWYTNRVGGSTIDAPRTVYGRAPLAGEVRRFHAWDVSPSGKNAFNKKPGYTIICSGNFEIADRVWQTTTPSSSDETSVEEFNEPYARMTQVAPAIMVDGIDPIGENNLHAQSSPFVKTEYGKLWDDINAGRKNPDVNELRRLVIEAKNADSNADRQRLDLDESNKAGMAEGGVLNVTEQTRYAKIKVSTTVTTNRITTCNWRQKWDYTNNRWKEPTKSCSVRESKSSTSTRAVYSGTLRNTGFWQMISVHCNRDEFNALVNATEGVEVINTGDPSRGISATAVTKKYDMKPRYAPFGDASNPNLAQAASGRLGFFDKECPFACREVSNPASPGERAEPGVTGKTIPGTKTGATDGTFNTNAYEFFRDNQERLVKPALWVPKNTGVVSYDNATALTTTITRDGNGTPKVGDFFRAKAEDGREIFTGSGAPANQRNWALSPYSNGVSTQLAGEVRGIKVQSSWASERNRPQVFNFKWEYAPSVSTVFPARNLGFGPAGSQSKGELVSASSNIQGKCVAQYGTSDSYDTSRIAKNTGTGTVNTVDTGILETDRDPKSRPTNLVIKFVRAVGE